MLISRLSSGKSAAAALEELFRVAHGGRAMLGIKH
jgi:hypothetical protein